MVVEPVPSRLTAERIAEYEAAGYWRDEVLGDLLEARARERPDAIAVVDGPRRVTWATLLQLSRRLALHLWELGLRPGDVIVLDLPNWLEYIVGYHAIRFLGAVVCQPGVDWRSQEMEYSLAVGPARAAIIPGQFRDFDFPAMVAELRPRLPHLEHVLVARGAASAGNVSLDALLEDAIEARSSEEVLRRCRPEANQVSRLVFTSGTTGTPKAIMHTNNTTLHPVRLIAQDFQLGPEDVFYMYVPMSFNWGTTTGIYVPAQTGARVVLMDRFSPDKAVAEIEQERATYLPGPPTGFIALMNSEQLPRRDLGHLRLTMSGGAHCPVEVIQEIRSKFPVPFYEGFGMNEFGMASWTLPEDKPAEVDGSVGRPIGGTEFRVVDDQGRDVGIGQPGELMVRGAGVCVGYHRNPEANATSWDEAGWFYTGDLATVDSKGYFSIVGRKKDIIIRAGANVSPREVEEAILAHPKVMDVAALGLPDPYYGEVVCACVIPRPGETVELAELVEFLRPRIAHYKLPARLVECREFPTTSSGKVQKKVLAQRILESPA